MRIPFVVIVIRKILTISLLMILSSNGYSFGRSILEYHHLYKQEYYGEYGHKYTEEMYEFEHRWITISGGYDVDWDKAALGSTNLLSRIFGSKYNSDKLYNDEGHILMYSKKNAAIIAGSRHFSYHFFTYDYNSHAITGLLSAHFDGASNILYNVAYICSIPAKIIHFSWFCCKPNNYLMDQNGSGCIQDYSIIARLRMFLLMLWSLLLGLVYSIIMLFVGTLIGLCCHPFETIGNITVSFVDPMRNNLLISIIELCKAIIKPLISIVYWQI